MKKHLNIFSNPTIVTDSLVPVIWSRYSLGGEEHLDIEEDLVLRNIPNNGQLRVWHDFQNRFNPSYLP